MFLGKKNSKVTMKLCLKWNVLAVLVQVVFVSACSNVFQYFPDNLGGTFQVRHVPNVNLTIKLDIAVEGETQGRGSLQPAFDLNEVDRRLRERRPIQYIVKFPQTFTRPLVTKISKNNEVVCEDRYIPVGGYSFSMTHTFFYPNDDGPTSTGPTFSRPASASCPVCQQCPICSQCPVCPATTCDQRPFVSEPTRNQIDRTRGGEDFSRCGVVRRAQALVRKGQTVAKGQWPWQAAIFVFKADSAEVKTAFQCAGVLISARHVLSAAHCFITASGTIRKDDVTVVLGQDEIDDWENKNIIVKKATDIISNRDFDRNTFEADIALIKFEIVRLTNFIRPACLWNQNIEIDDMLNEVGVVVGWGRDENGVFTRSPKSANISLIGKEVCRRSHELYSTLTAGSFCGEGMADTSVCAGDSGGGLLFNVNNQWTVRGIVSSKAPADLYSEKCDAENYDVYTDVWKYITWIQAQLK